MTRPEPGPVEPAADEPVKLGTVGRVLAIPLVPFVAAWEALKAGGRAVVALSRAVGSAVRRAVLTVGRLVTAPIRAMLRALASLAARIRAAVVAAFRLVGRTLRMVVDRVVRPVRAAVRAVLAPLRALA
ncbi:MAG: hypothetical protein ACRD12_20660, partial [Acidimicrobiales bacterium]